MTASSRRRPLVDPSLVGVIRMPDTTAAPIVSLVLRLVVALGSLFVAALVVYLGGAGYKDNSSTSPISFNDAFYYATVSLSTTGYGDIVPVSPQARLVTTRVLPRASRSPVPHRPGRHHGRAAHRALAAVVPHLPLEVPRA